MPTSLIIADDFLGPADARGLRDAALRLTYPAQQGAFPGRNSLQRIEIAGLGQAVSQLVGESLAPLSPPQSHAKFRITLAADKGGANVHVDPAYWSAILYPSRPGDCQGGTEFFRHLPTGSDHALLDDDALAAMGYASRQDMHREIIERDGTDASKWEMTMRVPMRFNRLVLLRPWLRHAADPAFGDRMENGRLVYLMFFAAA